MSTNKNLLNRCDWCLSSETYINYHDKEWGVPTISDKKQFEFLVLESAQAGLSWSTILNKRENYKNAYFDFDTLKISNLNNDDISILLENKGIIRNKLKIQSSINNAKQFIKIQKEFGSFSAYIWKFTNYKVIVNNWNNIKEIPSKTSLSEQISIDLKKRGFKFLGATIIYSHLQALGIVNDHINTCFRYHEIIESYSNFYQDLKNIL